MPIHSHSPTQSLPLRVLRIDASGRQAGSVTRQLADRLVAGLAERHGEIQVTSRDVAEGLPFVDAEWIGANATDPQARDAAQRQVLAGSDALVREVQAADVLVIATPIYNFGVPASLKAWIDQIARARLTFRYTDTGPEGLLTGKRAYLLVASGGTPVGGAIDFATPWLRFVLGFLGISDVQVVAAERLMAQGEGAVRSAEAHIASLLDPAPVAEAA